MFKTSTCRPSGCPSIPSIRKTRRARKPRGFPWGELTQRGVNQIRQQAVPLGVWLAEMRDLTNGTCRDLRVKTVWNLKHQESMFKLLKQSFWNWVVHTDGHISSRFRKLWQAIFLRKNEDGPNFAERNRYFCWPSVSFPKTGPPWTLLLGSWLGCGQCHFQGWASSAAACWWQWLSVRHEQLSSIYVIFRGKCR
jgi:hypothetical protein